MLAERGTKVLLGARRSERLEALAGRIAASGGEAAWARADVIGRPSGPWLPLMLPMARGNC
jgi:NADP-dependent 3-hydroxy acid dehydrogenase YdfG